MKKPTFKASEVVCNGITAGAKQLINEQNYQTLSTFLSTHFMMASKKQILEELNDSGEISGDWMIGSRVSSNEKILTRMASGLYNYASALFNDEKELAEMWINSQIKIMTAKDIITIMESALIDCATADHWYTYEKEW